MRKREMDSQVLINLLNLSLHPEGGYYRRTYASDLSIQDNDCDRPIVTSIFYLLTTDSPISYFHTNDSDIMVYYQGEGTLTYYLLSPAGKFFIVELGRRLESDQKLQLLIPKGYWKAVKLTEGDYCLVSEAVIPGFNWEGHRFASLEDLNALNPAHSRLYKPLVKS